MTNIEMVDNCGDCLAPIPAGQDHCDDCIRDRVRIGHLTGWDERRARQLGQVSSGGRASPS